MYGKSVHQFLEHMSDRTTLLIALRWHRELITRDSLAAIASAPLRAVKWTIRGAPLWAFVSVCRLQDDFGPPTRLEENGCTVFEWRRNSDRRLHRLHGPARITISFRGHVEEE